MNMRCAVLDIDTLCTEESIQHMLPLVSNQRRMEALHYTHVFGQFCCLKSYVMLTNLLKQEYDIEKLPIFEFLEHGKPILSEYPHIHFSISHCKKAIAVAVHDAPIGIDIESIRPANMALIEKTMNTQERAYIQNSHDSNETFIELWTKKEAVVKQTGDGLNLENLQMILPNATQTIDTHREIEKGYIWSICY